MSGLVASGGEHLPALLAGDGAVLPPALTLPPSLLSLPAEYLCLVLRESDVVAALQMHRHVLGAVLHLGAAQLTEEISK